MSGPAMRLESALKQQSLQSDFSNWRIWKKIIHSQRFLKTKDSQVFFCKWTNKIQGSTMQPLKTLKLIELTWPLRKQPWNSWMLLVLLQKTKERFVFENVVIG